MGTEDSLQQESPIDVPLPSRSEILHQRENEEGNTTKPPFRYQTDFLGVLNQQVFSPFLVGGYTW